MKIKFDSVDNLPLKKRQILELLLDKYYSQDFLDEYL